MATRAEPRFETRDDFTVVGLSMRATPEANFSAHWTNFDARQETFAELTDTNEAFGVEYDFDPASDSFTYLAGVEPARDAPLPSDAEQVDVPGGRYAVFTTTLEDLDDVMDYVYTEWFPNTEFERGEGPEFEYYGPDFDPSDPEATFDVYVPVAN
ncbi:GyrI-like domain-containing protein [Haloarchaeobius sp. TZWWS8]|uniref:GyrI-like domain-containing protein n=1 Tax=Haloarchaeobius sp. TZWWS8 TaxID=3446121 RepID=UPI003EB7B550